MNLCHKPVFSSRMRRFTGARSTSKTTSSWVVPNESNRCNAEILRWLGIRAIAEEVGIDKMIARPGYLADDRS